MFDVLGRWIARRPWRVLGLWALAGVVLFAAAPKWEDRCQDDDIRFLPSRCLSVAGYQLLRQAFPQEAHGSKAICVLERMGAPLTAADLALSRRIAAAIQELRQERPELGLGVMTTPGDPITGERYRSADGRCALVSVAVQSPFLAMKTSEAVEQLERRVRPIVEAARTQPGYADHEFRFQISGSAGIGRDLNAATYRSLDTTTLATVLLVVTILLLVYRSPILALVPLATIGMSVWISLEILALLTIVPEFQLVNITRVFVVVVLYGAGTDYCLFLISRYREEHDKGRPDPLCYSLRHVGWALTASAATVVCGLGMMGFAEFAKLRYTGPAIALSLVVGLIGSLTLAPALLQVLGGWAFWPRRCAPASTWPRPARPASESRIWEPIGRLVAARPLTVWLAIMAALTPLAYLGYHTTYAFDVVAELPASSNSRQGIEIIQNHFPVGEIGPLTVLLAGPRDWSQAEGWGLLQDICRDLEQLPGVEEVRGLTRPLGKALDSSEENGGLLARISSLKEALVQQGARNHYLACVNGQSIARLDVVFRTEPFSQESVQTMKLVKAKVEQRLAAASAREPAATCSFYGITPMIHDISSIHETDRRLVHGLVLGGILLILVVLVRRPLVAIYLLATVLFSYYVAIGLTELMAYGWLDNRIGQVDWKVPYFLFTILISVGEDYNIFLMTRVMEESRRHGLRQGIHLALTRTGGTITSCGIIMAGTFSTMMLCTLTTLAQLGLALAVGVLLDTLLVRPVLVPTFLLVMDRWTRAAAAEPAADLTPALLKEAA